MDNPNSDTNTYWIIKNNKQLYIKKVENKVFKQQQMVSFEEDKTYKNIYNGEWLNNGDYAVIHRIAVSENSKGNGIASTIIKKSRKFM